MAKLVAYCRVSTQSQGRSGLGLAAQLDAIRNFAKSEDHEIIRPEYVEIESGAKDDRPKLALAVKQCRTYGATLVVAKADRLTRSGETVDQFAKRNRISVIALDNVNGDDVFAILSAAVGSVERKLISKRTRAALQALKSTGKTLGGYRGTPPRDYAQALGAATAKANADQRAADVTEVLAEIDPAGGMSLAALASALNDRNVATARGGKWSATQVMRVKVRS